VSRETDELAGKVHRYGLDVFPGYFGLSSAQQERGFNGVGPDSWRDWMRDLLGYVAPILKPAAFIHDLEATYANDGTREGFEAWNRRFRKNGITTVRREVSAWRFLARQALYKEVETAYKAVSSGEGWKAWQAAARRIP
jgi:hypothetical protein